MTGTRAVIAALALLLGLSACSGEDPEPRVAPPSPTEPSTTGTAAETPPEMPEAAKGTDAAAAEAFVKFYWATVNYAQATGNTDALRALGDNCVNCDNSVDFIEEVYGGGGHIRGGQGTPTDVDVSFTELQNEWSAIVDFVLTLTPQDVDLPGEADDKHYKGGEREIRMYLQPADGSWVVRTMGFP